jgi:hypothetical protein
MTISKYANNAVGCQEAVLSASKPGMAALGLYPEG